MKKVFVSLVFVSANVCGMTENFSRYEGGNLKQSAIMQQIPCPVPQAEGNSGQSARRSERLQIRQAVRQSLEDASTSSNDGKRKRVPSENNCPKSKGRKANSNQVQQPVRRSEKLQTQQAMIQNPMESSDLIQELKNDEKDNENLLRQTDPERWEKIKIFMELQTKKQDKKRKYSSDHLRSALMYYCVYREVSIAEIADIFGFNCGTFRHYVSEAGILRKSVLMCTEEEINRMLKMRKDEGVTRTSQLLNRNSSTILRHAKKRGEAPLFNYVEDEKILDWYKSGGNFKDLYEIVTSGESNAKTKFADVISARMSAEQKRLLVEGNMDIIADFKKGFLTEKGLINKYKDRHIRIGDVCVRKFGECEDYLIRNIAGRLGYDLLKSAEKWDIKYESCTQLGKDKRYQMIDDHNKGFLTDKGLAKKYQTNVNTIKTIRAWGGRQLKINPKHTFKNSYKSVDFSNISLAKQHLKYLGYQESMINEMILFVNQYNKLTPDQKNLFKTISEQNVADRRMPSDEELDEIKPIRYGDDKVNEKFRKLLLILCNKKNEIRMDVRSINRLERGLGIWIKLNAQANL